MSKPSMNSAIEQFLGGGSIAQDQISKPSQKRVKARGFPGVMGFKISTPPAAKNVNKAPANKLG